MIRGICRRTQGLVLFGVALGSLVGARSAHADADVRPIADALSVGTSPCLDRKALAEHLGMWLHKSNLDRRLAVEVTETPRGVRFVLRREGAILGERVLRIENVGCQQIDAAVGLGIASAIDATILSDLGVVAPAVSVPASPRPPVSMAEKAPPVAQPSAERSPVPSLAMQGMVLVGALPRPTLGVAPSIELSIARSFDVRASALVTAARTIPVGEGAADVSLVAGRLDACVASVLANHVVLRGCLGVLGGAIPARGSAFATPKTTISGWVAPALRLDLRWSVTQSFGFVVGVDGFFPVVKPELQVLDPSDQIVAAQAFPIAGMGIGAGPSLKF